MSRSSFVWPLFCAVTAVGPAMAQVLHVATLNTDQIRALDRQKTVVILPGGILEEHGPYLPSYTDGYFNERLARDLADAIAERPGWTALMFPPVPLGAVGANQIGRKTVFPGTFAVRAATLRAVFMDLADELGEQGFRWVFIVHGHGGPMHNRALDEAGRYFQDTWQGQMVHLLGAADARACCDEWKALLSDKAVKEDGFTVHGGAGESSVVAFLRPDLVAPGIRQAASVTASDFAGLETAARKPEWPGYFGAPRYASAAAGAVRYRARARHVVDEALRRLDGQVETGPRLADVLAGNPVVRGIAADSAADDAGRESRQREWLARQPAWPPAAPAANGARPGP